MRRWLGFSALIAVAIVSAVPSAHATVLEDEQIGSPHGSQLGAHGVEFNEVSGLRDNVSVAYTEASPQQLCTSVSTAPCSSGDFAFRAVLGPCASQADIDCIESVTATLNGQTTAGVPNGTFPAHGVTDFVGSDQLGIPSGSAPGMWNFSGVPHAFGNEYQVTAMVSGRSLSGNALKAPRSFFANITPVSRFQTTCTVQSNGHCMDTYYEDSSVGKVRFAGVAADQDGGFRCQNWGENAVCALKHAFPLGIRFALKVRMRTAPSGWMHGRMTDPSASLLTSDGVTTLTVDAGPTLVPVVAASAQYASLPTAIQNWFDTNCPCGSRRPINDWADSSTRNAVSMPPAYKESSFSMLELWREYVADKAYAVPSVWNVRTMSDSEMSAAPKCIRNGVGVTGIVSTNATLYAEGPPAFDTSTSTLRYKVSAPHWEKDGITPFLGRYDLLVRDDIAECLYGAPDFNAGTSSVTVASQSGATKSATTGVTRDGGWWHFSASGYTHSAPVLRARLDPKWPTVRKGRTMKVTALARIYGVTVPTRSRIVASVGASSRSVCSISRALVVSARKVGLCRMTISVTPPKSKKVRNPVTVRRTVTMKVGR